MNTLHTVLIIGGVAVVGFIFREQIMDAIGDIFGGSNDPVPLETENEDAYQGRITVI
ncbi:MAG TPA: hypothetical protein VF433_07535 [Cellvibrio sp.]